MCRTYPLASLGMTLQEAVSRNVRVIAAARGTTPTEAARRVGMHASRLHAKLQGKTRWNVEDLELLAAALDVEPARLVSGLAEFKCIQPKPIMNLPARSGPPVLARLRSAA